MAVVYRAYDPELDRLLALKLILHRDDEAEASERLLREAQALAQLSHPNVVAVYDVAFSIVRLHGDGARRRADPASGFGRRRARPTRSSIAS
jgi:serine/threonine protein kinase